MPVERMTQCEPGSRGVTFINGVGRRESQATLHDRYVHAEVLADGSLSPVKTGPPQNVGARPTREQLWP